jgi:spermidine synthase
VAFRGGRRPAAEVYGLEAAGAFAGGLLFTFVFSGRVGATPLAALLSAVFVLVSVLVFRRRVALALVAIPLLLHVFMGSLKPPTVEAGELIRMVQSRYGEIWVTELEGQRSLYGSGQLLFSYPDPQVEERAVHLPMSVNPRARRVLALGGSPATLGEYLKYPVKRVDFVEMDPVLLETSVGMLDEADRKAVESERVRLIVEDGRRYIKSLKRPEYDMIVMNLPPPSTANLNRFYTVEFFREARAALSPGGVLSVRVPSSSGYVGRRMRLANGSIYKSLKKTFAHVGLTTEEYGVLFASDSALELAPEDIKSNFSESGVETRHFHPYILEDAFTPMRAAFHERRLATVDAVNTDRRPSAYLYNLMLWAEVHGGVLNVVLSLSGITIAIMALGAFVLAALTVLRKRARTLYYSIFTAGYAGMAVVLAIVLAYQAAYGYVYEMMGLLGAIFMVGVAAGSYAMRGGGRRKLMGLEATVAVFAVVVPLLFQAEALYYLLSFLAGGITGYQFALVNHIMGRQEAAGRLYAFDLAGSFAGAVLSAIILIPMLGIQGALLFLAGVKAISFAAVSLIRQ